MHFKPGFWIYIDFENLKCEYRFYLGVDENYWLYLIW